jgi:hypothetical protein
MRKNRLGRFDFSWVTVFLGGGYFLRKVLTNLADP